VATTELGEAAAAWATTRRTSVGPVNIRYREAGSGPAVVLVHGLGMAADYWTRTGPALGAAGFRVLAPDLPGFGETEGPDDGLPIQKQAAALRQWAVSIGLEPAVYVGHSLSCQSVLELAVRWPDSVTGLILAAPTGNGGRLRMLAEAWGLLRDATRESFELLVIAGHAYLRAGFLRFFHTWRSGADHDPLPLLPRISVPALVVVGDRDPVVSLDYATQFTNLLTKGRLQVIAGGTHAVFFHRPQEFNASAIEFLQSLD
jgi:2-hydroxy-6-oxonona-2,4-dienedioate hydrolase